MRPLVDAVQGVAAGLPWARGALAAAVASVLGFGMNWVLAVMRRSVLRPEVWINPCAAMAIGKLDSR